MASKLFVVCSTVLSSAVEEHSIYTPLSSAILPFSPGAFCDMKTRLKAILLGLEMCPPSLCGNLSGLFVC